MHTRIRGIKRYRSKDRWYAYHRRTRRRLRSDWGTRAFFEEIAELDALAARQAQRRCVDSLQRLFDSFVASERYRDYCLHERTAFHAVMVWMSDKDAGINFRTIDRDFVKRLRNRAFRLRGPRFANRCLALMQVLLGFAVERGELCSNVALGMHHLRPSHPRLGARRKLRSIHQRASRQ